MLADKAIIEACNAIHQYGAMGAATPSQFAGVEAISEASDKDIEEHKQSFEARRNFIVSRLNRMGLYTPMPKGAFYVFPNISVLGMNSDDFCMQLLKEQTGMIKNQYPIYDTKESGDFIAHLPYELTGAQKRALDEMKKTSAARMEAFIQGIV